jgi:hypothetical protein
MVLGLLLSGSITQAGYFNPSFSNDQNRESGSNPASLRGCRPMVGQRSQKGLMLSSLLGWLLEPFLLLIDARKGIATN